MAKDRTELRSGAQKRRDRQRALEKAHRGRSSLGAPQGPLAGGGRRGHSGIRCRNLRRSRDLRAAGGGEWRRSVPARLWRAGRRCGEGHRQCVSGQGAHAGVHPALTRGRAIHSPLLRGRALPLHAPEGLQNFRAQLCRERSRRRLVGEAAQILGGRSLALCQALAITSENDFGTLYRPGFALLAAASPWHSRISAQPPLGGRRLRPPRGTMKSRRRGYERADTGHGQNSWSEPLPWMSPEGRLRAAHLSQLPGRMKLLAVVKNPASIARYLAAAGELTEVPSRSPGRGPPYWKSRVLRRQALGDEGRGAWPWASAKPTLGVRRRGPR